MDSSRNVRHQEGDIMRLALGERGKGGSARKWSKRHSFPPFLTVGKGSCCVVFSQRTFTVQGMV